VGFFIDYGINPCFYWYFGIKWVCNSHVMGLFWVGSYLSTSEKLTAIMGVLWLIKTQALKNPPFRWVLVAYMLFNYDTYVSGIVSPDKSCILLNFIIMRNCFFVIP